MNKEELQQEVLTLNKQIDKLQNEIESLWHQRKDLISKLTQIIINES